MKKNSNFNKMNRSKPEKNHNIKKNNIILTKNNKTDSKSH